MKLVIDRFGCAKVFVFLVTAGISNFVETHALRLTEIDRSPHGSGKYIYKASAGTSHREKACSASIGSWSHLVILIPRLKQSPLLQIHMQ
jgi:hypothetical protein